MDEGEEFIVTRDGVSARELPPARRRLVRTELLLNAMRGIPPIEADMSQSAERSQ